jgi:uncharacterized protein YjbI with pentapeptide repeats
VATNLQNANFSQASLRGAVLDDVLRLEAIFTDTTLPDGSMSD